VSPRYLAPNESLTEAVAGLIMVLTFTLAASIVTGGGEDAARAALLGAIGCNVAWGIIDAVLYIMDSVFERNRRVRLAHAVASVPDEPAAIAAIQRELDPYLASVTLPAHRDQLYRHIRSSLVHGSLPQRTGVLRDDVIGAVAVFCVVLATALPAILPLALIHQPWLALRVSNLLVVAMLFIVGYRWAKYVDANPWLTGLGLMGVGLALVVVAIPLGG
jgi:hypothetical protein